MQVLFLLQNVDFALVRGVYFIAGVAQLVEQLICNQQVAGSSPIASSKQVWRRDGEKRAGSEAVKRNRL